MRVPSLHSATLDASVFDIYNDDAVTAKDERWGFQSDEDRI